MGGASSFAARPAWPALRPPSGLVAAGVGVVGAVALAGTVGATGTEDNPGIVALARGLIAGVPLVVGLVAVRRPATRRLGGLLVATGVGCSITALAESGDALPYTVGRAAAWPLEVLLIYLVLAFPSGRLPDRTDRLLVGAMAAVMAILFVPRLVIAERFQSPSPYSSCIDDCPDNAFFALQEQPALVESVLQPAGFVCVFLVTAAVVARLVHRTATATPLARRMHLPVIVIAGLRASLILSAVGVYAVDRDAWQVTAWILALSVPAIALAFGAGLMRWRLFEARALRRLARSALDVGDAPALRRMLARALDDPSLAIAFPAPDAEPGWLDDGSRRVSAPVPRAGRALLEVHDDGRTVAVVEHDPTLGDEPALLEAVTSITGAVLANQRLATEWAAALREMRRSRARVAARAQRERRRIERELHEGAEQRLAALRIQLPVVGDVVRRDPRRGLERLRGLEAELDTTLEEVRTLAHGVVPPLLADRGLAPALRSRALEAALPLEIVAYDVGRYRPELESAVYFAVLEALRELAPTLAKLTLREADGWLGVALRADGARREGRVDPAWSDRLAAVGGEATTLAAPGHGRLLRGAVPVAGGALG